MFLKFIISALLILPVVGTAKNCKDLVFNPEGKLFNSSVGKGGNLEQAIKLCDKPLATTKLKGNLEYYKVDDYIEHLLSGKVFDCSDSYALSTHKPEQYTDIYAKTRASCLYWVHKLKSKYQLK
jgi:hypothetical protein